MTTAIEQTPSSVVLGTHKSHRVRAVHDSPVAQFLFSDTRMAWFWLVVRVYVGWQWLTAGWAKVNNPDWFGATAGTSLTKFVTGALDKTTGAHPDVQAWYGWFLQNVVLPNARLWSYLVTAGEVLVGVALILGLFTGLAAFFGSFMNVSYLLAGTVSVNPVLFVLATWLVLAWKTAGWLGLDRWVLRALGTTWRPTWVLQEVEPAPQPRA